jgi:hypothetical protein
VERATVACSLSSASFCSKTTLRCASSCRLSSSASTASPRVKIRDWSRGNRVEQREKGGAEGRADTGNKTGQKRVRKSTFGVREEVRAEVAIIAVIGAGDGSGLVVTTVVTVTLKGFIELRVDGGSLGCNGLCRDWKS